MLGRLLVGRGSEDGRLGLLGETAVYCSVLGRLSVGRGSGDGRLGLVGGFGRLKTWIHDEVVEVGDQPVRFGGRGGRKGCC